MFQSLISKPSSRQKYSAFSLLEISIVMVVMGILFVGVSKGRVLIENARIKQTASTLQELHVAVLNYLEDHGSFETKPDNTTESQKAWRQALESSGLYGPYREEGLKPRMGGWVALSHNPDSLEGLWLYYGEGENGNTVPINPLLTPQQAWKVASALGGPSETIKIIQKGGDACLTSTGRANLKNTKRSCALAIKV